MEIINITEYRTKYPADSRYTDNSITTSINMSFDTIDGKYCAGQISSRWELEENNGGFTEKQKGYIKTAFLIQTRWLLQTGLNYPAGTYQRTNGSQSLNLTINKRDDICEGVIYWLELAGITTTINGGSVLGNGKNCKDECQNSKYITQEVADAKYINTQYTGSDGEKVKNKIPHFNNNSIVEYISPQDIVNIAESTLKTLQNGISENKINITINKNDIGALKDSVSSVASDLNELDRDTTKNTTNITALQKSQSEIAIKVNENTKNIATQDTKIDNLEKKVDSYDTQAIIDLSNRVSKLEKENQWELLWTNPNSSESFNSQYIKVSNLSNYRQILVGFSGKKGEGNNLVCCTLDQDAQNCSIAINYDRDSNYNIIFRVRLIVLEITDDSIYVYSCQSNNSTAQTNDYLIPYQIFGKGKIN